MSNNNNNDDGTFTLIVVLMVFAFIFASPGWITIGAINFALGFGLTYWYLWTLSIALCLFIFHRMKKKKGTRKAISTYIIWCIILTSIFCYIHYGWLNGERSNLHMRMYGEFIPPFLRGDADIIYEIENVIPAPN